MKNKRQYLLKDSSYTVRVLHPNDVDDGLLFAWADLEARAVVQNDFISTNLIMTAIRYL